MSTNTTSASARSTAIQPPPAVLIVGGESFLTERVRSEIIAQVRTYTGQSSLPVDKRSIGDIDAGELAELLSPSLFAEDRLIVITDLHVGKKEALSLLEDAVKNPIPGVTLILEHTGTGRTQSFIKTMKALGVPVHSAAELKRHEKIGFIVSEFRRHGEFVSQDIAENFFLSVGSDVREIAAAVSQLVADTHGPITLDAIQTYYQGRAEVSGFDVAELALTGHIEPALRAVRRALQVGVDPILISSALGTMVGQLARITNAGRIIPQRDASKFGMPTWKLEKNLRIAQHWDNNSISHAVQLVAALDSGIKGGSASPEYEVESAIMKLARLSH